MKQTVFEVYMCETGCGRRLPDPGMCAECEDEVSALRAAYFAEDPRWAETRQPWPEPVYWLGVGFVVGVAAYLFIQFLSGF